MQIRNTTYRKSSRGYTLHELLVVMGIVSIIAVSAVPAMGSLVAGARLDGAMTRLQSGVSLARSEAITRNTPVTICRSQDGANCAASGSWAEGWMIFVDRNANGLRNHATEKLIYMDQEARVDYLVSTTGDIDAALTYFSDGSVSASGHINICVPGHEARRLVINRVGHNSTESIATESCSS